RAEDFPHIAVPRFRNRDATAGFRLDFSRGSALDLERKVGWTIHLLAKLGLTGLLSRGSIDGSNAKDFPLPRQIDEVVNRHWLKGSRRWNVEPVCQVKEFRNHVSTSCSILIQPFTAWACRCMGSGRWPGWLQPLAGRGLSLPCPQWFHTGS